MAFPVTSPRTWSAGEIVTPAMLNTELRDQLTGLAAAWASYTPILTAATTNPTLGTGATQAGRYMRIGKTVLFAAYIKLGTSGVAAGSGFYSISLPVGVANATVKYLVPVLLLDSSSGTYVDATGQIEPGGTVITRIRYGGGVGAIASTTSSTTVGDTTPWTWAAGDELIVTGVYEAA